MHYWLDSWPHKIDETPGCDQQLVSEGYVSLTPLTWSMMDGAVLNDLKAFEGER